MLDDKDEFARFFFEDFSVPTLRSIKEGAILRLAKKDFALATETQLQSWLRDIDIELSHRGICTVCWRMACLCPD